jgi:succinylglutamate desuccinylase
MAGVHGNEKSGIHILEELADILKVTQGSVHLILQANPRAIKQNIRQTEKNMNRAFHDIPQ